MEITDKRFKSERNYADWMIVKDRVQFKKVMRSFKEWEIWWCAVGENVGTEINGKGKDFSRPVIIFKKLDRFSFTAIPLTTKDHTKKYPDRYVHFIFKNKDEYAAVHQLENVSVYRLQRKMGHLDDEDIYKIINRVKKFYLKNAPSRRGVGGKIPNCKFIITKIVSFCKKVRKRVDILGRV